MSKLSEQWIELFRAGDYGEKGKYTAADLDAMVRNSDPSFHEVPIVIGHPRSDAPAWGWIGQLKREGDLLLGKPSSVQPEFEEMVDRKLFKKRSVSIYATEKGPMLRHVGFLGAQPPVVKGLADAHFQDEQREVTEVIFEEEQMAAEEQGLWEKIKAYLDGKQSAAATLAAPAKTYSEDDVKKIIADAVKPFTDQVTSLQTELTAQKTNFAESERRATAERLGRAASEAVAGLKAQGRWIPAFDKMKVPELFSELAKQTVTIEFGEGDKKENRSLLDAAVSVFGALPKIVPPGTMIHGAHAAGAASDFSENPGSRTRVDQNSAKLSALAKALVREKNIDFGEALAQVSREHPELTLVDGASAGQV